jgi:RNA polymerase sigma factor (sigma-70 family)
MSPLNVRRYRAERLLKGEFEALRGRVAGTVRARLRGSGVTVDDSDLEAAYSQAWQGLYLAVLEGEEIANPAGWLAVVTFRRAIDEHRAGGRRGGRGLEHVEVDLEDAREQDLAARLDDHTRLRQLFEGLRGRLSDREREAAVLCYLQGLTRSQAAARMGVSETRMRKLMEGSGAGSPGVAGKLGALVDTIRDGGWCEEQGSLMRALAYGILDPQGERYQLAVLHRHECPSCRMYVASLRGLAATLPPVFLPWGLGAAALARAGSGAQSGAAHTGATAGAGSGGAGGGAGGAAAGVGATGAGAAGAGGGFAGGGWLFAGGAKLAAGCVLALSVGAGCVALTVDGEHVHTPVRRDRHAPPLGAGTSAAADVARVGDPLTAPSRLGQPVPGHARSKSAALTPTRRASREFGPEQALAGSEHHPTAVSAARAVTTQVGVSTGASGAGSTAGATGASQAEREFSPG